MRKIRTVKELQSPARDLPEGITLVVGEAISEQVADDLVARGYAVEHEEESPPSPELEEMTKDALTHLAESMGIDVKARWSKQDLIDAIHAEQEKQGGGDA